MYNNHDEMYEVSDLDQDIALRKELIEEAKNLMAQEEPDAKEISSLRRAWNRINYWESAFEDALIEEFDACLDTYYAKKRAAYASVQEAKEELIKQAHLLTKTTDFHKATEEMNELMSRWKEAGHAGREKDDALWNEFNQARQKFFDLKHDYFEKRKEQYEKARSLKSELISKAKELVDSSEWQKTSQAYRELMDEWKRVGSAGRDFEDALWNDFQEARQRFYDRRNAYYDTLHEEQNQKYEAKALLLAKVKEIVEAKEYTKENTAMMKQYGAEWKTIGNCGKDREEAIWNEFRLLMDDYFNGLKEWNDQKHARWIGNMQEIRNRKLELIQNQKRQIERMKQDMVGLLGQRAIDEMEEDIEDKEAFIEELEAQIADIDDRLKNA